jgi:hypothetical protein
MSSIDFQAYEKNKQFTKKNLITSLTVIATSPSCNRFNAYQNHVIQNKSVILQLAEIQVIFAWICAACSRAAICQSTDEIICARVENADSKKNRES